MKKRLSALITGASRGIGKAIALEFAKAGYDLILTCHTNREKLEETIREAESFGICCSGFCFDAGDYDSAADSAAKILQEIGTPDLLINNAGISHIGLLTDMTPAEWQNILNTNLTSIFNMCHLFLPAMIRRQSGHIINISSVWGNVGASCEVAYSATKGGINSFTKALAKELAPSHIQVNAIACGAIDTEMNSFLSDEERQMLIDEIPACRMGRPEEVGQMALSMAAAPEYMTGQIITMDGGWL